LHQKSKKTRKKSLVGDAGERKVANTWGNPVKHSNALRIRD